MAVSPKPHHYVIADLHLGHRKLVDPQAVLKKPHRPFDSIEHHDKFIIKRINAVCSPSSYLWVLGDVSFSRSSLDLLTQIHCSLALIGGNHDTRSMQTYLSVFNQVRHQAEVRCDSLDMTALLTHIPIHPSEMYRWSKNIHGHLHTRSVKTWYGLKDRRYVCVSCEQIDYTPVKIETLLS